jgi:lysyl-tRNA synthetase class 2
MYRQAFIRKNLLLRMRIIQAVRRFFNERDYLEVETPIRIPAPVPEAHIDVEASGNWYLQTSPEVCMKRLLAAGYPRMFQICKCFRQRERGNKHLPEFTILEWYCANSGYKDMMDQCEKMIRSVSQEVGGADSLVYQAKTIDLRPPWPRMTVKQAFETFSPIPIEEAIRSDRFEEIMVGDIEPNLGHPKPLFLCDYPAAMCSLSRLKPEDLSVAERFELYIAGLELCNAFTELNDPVEQRVRFHRDQQHRMTVGKKVYPMPEKFLESLSGMPESSGNALGIDRFVMLFANAATIDEVVTFTPEEL